MNEKMCKHCDHFFQHYGLRHNKFYRLYCGHCTAAQVKHKRPDTKACERFIPISHGEKFATKEYLTKRMLEHILRMELLPEIME